MAYDSKPLIQNARKAADAIEQMIRVLKEAEENVSRERENRKIMEDMLSDKKKECEELQDNLSEEQSKNRRLELTLAHLRRPLWEKLITWSRGAETTNHGGPGIPSKTPPNTLL